MTYAVAMTDAELARAREELRMKLRALREARFTQGELARRLKMSRPSVSMIESGASGPHIDTLITWLHECGARLEIVVDGDRASASLARLNSREDRDLVALLADVIPTLHPVRREDLIATLRRWRTLGDHDAQPLLVHDNDS
jgi:transcriptional regulator with XRE-family HTH domain